ncbi:MAG TPA: hypothetical protein VGX16_01565 [Solirubrobacteraceae bacterium]|nr:hypothetical protein [Solirubrobacteraceae bacterium]
MPAPPSERHAWLLAAALAFVGLAVLTAVLTGLVGRSAAGVRLPPPPPILITAATPTGASAAASAGAAAEPVLAVGTKTVASASTGAIVAAPSSAQQEADRARFQSDLPVHIPAAWVAGFYPIYETAQRTFGVDWLLLASIHRQESAFSTAPGIYHGLNFAGCCGGPMQFNVTNGGVGIPSTWDLVRSAYRYGRRPAAYDHPTARHPSIYDDFDSVMAAAWLLSSDGAGLALDQSAWNAAYDYYGHDATGVTYADQVLARAIGWSQHGFCINCGPGPALVTAVHEAYGAPVLAGLEEARAASVRRAPPKHRG